ncbi:restriction endonuclease subunit S [Candidatus Saccharibacteria bacterium]|nr:restriction endonuclease subunit S [Candidatus Saccharibacteria bacterium]MBI3337830.1 restriction endonuclease subunit S [Candidatus Saccharibacteria bacterium]
MNHSQIPDGWHVKKLKQTGEAIIGLTYSPKDVVDSGGIEVLRSSNVQHGRIVLDDLVRVNAKIPEKIILQDGDILVCARNGSRRLIGKNARINRHNIGKTFGAFMCVYRSDNPNYMYWVFQTESFRKQIARDLGPTINQVTTGNLNSFKFAFPSEDEQARIVTVLEVWDEYVEKLDKKIELKKNIKKGLMQDLLTGEIQIPGFNGEWQEVKLGENGETYAGLSGKTKEDFGQGKPYITYMNIYSNPTVDQNNYELVKLDHEESQNKVKYGDILFTTSSETPEEVGIASVYLGNDSELYLNSFCFGFRLKQPAKLSPKFARHYFRGQQFRKTMTRIAQGASRYNLSKRYFMETKIRIPVDIAEQERIAELLDNISFDIKLLHDKRQLVLNQKKYLVNNLIRGDLRTPEDLRISIKEMQHA